MNIIELEKIEMLIYLDADIIKTKEYAQLTKDDLTQMIELMGNFAKHDEVNLPYEKVTFKITDDFISKTRTWFNYGLIDISIKKSFSWKRNNKKNVANYRARKKFGEPEVEVKEEVKEEVNVIKEQVVESKKVNKIDFKIIANDFNDIMAPFLKNSKSEHHFKYKKLSKVLVVTPKREKLIISTYNQFKDLFEVADIYEFYRNYFKVISYVENKEPKNYLNTLTGWADSREKNGTNSGWYNPNFDYIIKSSTFSNIIEQISG